MASITIERPATETRKRPVRRSKPQLIPRYALILHNDNINGFDFVIGVLQKVLGYTQSKALWLTLKAHTTGAATIFTGSLELAELRAEQITACGPDPRKVADGAQPLRLSIEPLD